jgi:shikimate dehydrogenase
MKNACVIGWPVAHSRSPVIHRYWLRRYGIDGDYTKVAVEPGEVDTFIRRLRENGFDGCNVTLPHKERMLELADEASDEARAIGAANTLWFREGRLMATNTDAFGYMAHLQATAPQWSRSAGPVLVLGAGGAARAIVHGFLGAGVERIVVVNRNVERAETVVRGFGGRASARAWGDWRDVASTAGVVVNTTTLGMEGMAALDFDVGQLAPHCVVSDVVYVPLETPLLAAARARGLAVVDGLGMLLYQAIPGFELWFGVKPQVTDALRAEVVADLGAH